MVCVERRIHTMRMAVAGWRLYMCICNYAIYVHVCYTVLVCSGCSYNPHDDAVFLPACDSLRYACSTDLPLAHIWFAVDLKYARVRHVGRIYANKSHIYSDLRTHKNPLAFRFIYDLGIPLSFMYGSNCGLKTSELSQLCPL